MTGTAHVIRGDALALPLPDSSVDLICTSPPYFALRSYQDGGEHYAGQLGSEATPTEFVDALIAATREMVRVLKPSGSIWVNLGDKYAMDGKWGGSSGDRNQHSAHHVKRQTGIRSKSLMGIPWRYANRCVDELGLILRRDQIWSKPNGLPESITDRCRSSHEYWFHFVTQPRYFSAIDEIREPQKTLVGPTHGRHGAGKHSRMGERGDQVDDYTFQSNPLGKLPGSVWTIPTEPLIIPDHISHAVCCQGRKRDGCVDGIDHFAAYPTEWPRRIIQGWAPSGVCVECGEGRRPVTHKKPMEWRPGPKAGGYELAGQSRVVVSGTMLAAAETTITGYACACLLDPIRIATWEPPPTRPAVILDPFGGTGTTALVAKALSQTGISVDMSADYCRIATWRTNDPDQLAKAARVAKPPKQLDGQLGFEFEELTA